MKQSQSSVKLQGAQEPGLQQSDHSNSPGLRLRPATQADNSKTRQVLIANPNTANVQSQAAHVNVQSYLSGQDLQKHAG